MPLTKEAHALVDAFARQPGVTVDQAANLAGVINHSPTLVDQINEAVKLGHLKQIVPLPLGTHAGGEYNGAAKEMRLPLSMLTSPPKGVPFDAGEPTFVLEHELQHGFNHAATEQATTTFIADTKQVAQSKGPTHDYTAALGALIAANRRDEAGAEVAGWNALASRVQHDKPRATLEDIYNANPFRAGDLIDRTGTPPNYHYAAKPNIALDKDLHMQPTASNIEGMGRNYFDHPPAQAGLGHHGNSDYANYYGAWGTGVVVQSERAYGDGKAQLEMNLKQLHLSERLMEQNGLNLGSDTSPMPYRDTSTTPPTTHRFNHTATTFTHIPIVFQGLPLPVAEATREGPSRPGHPDHALFKQIEAGVAAQELAHGEDADRMSHSLLALAKEQGISRADHVVRGGGGEGGQVNVFLIQGKLQDPAQRRAWIDASQAMQTPQEASIQRIEQVNTSAQALDSPQQSAPVQAPARLAP
ncbi:XVIPCD domain-containing protein [Pseudoxanthomonas sp. JBR18]|uniref:XVIPCD domain-containing protein n=1 Tax=Pseudoxanthomonas sp. JBR18 TaxID=2969308 RepID=UPI0023065D0D|nr:XVIPCD domain-containing protein [Pseudoxanthomonas sp. JBR18]WCE05820.1 hypothetical protein PJ250_07695 [Pseudoxanthomonas sp. JBR18]